MAPSVEGSPWPLPSRHAIPSARLALSLPSAVLSAQQESEETPNASFFSSATQGSKPRTEIRGQPWSRSHLFFSQSPRFPYKNLNAYRVRSLSWSKQKLVAPLRSRVRGFTSSVNTIIYYCLQYYIIVRWYICTFLPSLQCVSTTLHLTFTRQAGSIPNLLKPICTRCCCLHVKNRSDLYPVPFSFLLFKAKKRISVVTGTVHNDAFR